MNEREIKEAEAFYDIEEDFGILGDHLFEEYKTEIGTLLGRLWNIMNHLGITNEAARYALRFNCLNMLSTHLEYEASCFADQLREEFRLSTPTMIKEEK